MKRVVYTAVIACLALVLIAGAALAAPKKPSAPSAQFPTTAKITVTAVPPFFYTFSWTAATGNFDAYRLDLVKATWTSSVKSFGPGLATRYTVETLQGEGYPYVAPGDYKVTVNALSGGKVVASLAGTGTIKLK